MIYEKFILILCYNLGMHDLTFVAPLLWDMDEMYETTKGSHQLFSLVKTIMFGNCIHEFNT
jgi:hypothetical protein